MIKILKKLIYPGRCVFCREFLDKNSEEEICGECAVHLPWTGRKCRTRGEFFAECLSPLFYVGQVRAAVQRFKFLGKASYARSMGRLIADCVRENGKGGYDIVTWVPVSTRRIRKRGYCQAKLLAREVAGQLGLKCRKTLRKHRHTPPQSSLVGLAARRANISGAFRAVRKSGIAGRNILLVDDVVTTGATLSECTRILLMAGALEVSCATFCRSAKK